MSDFSPYGLAAATCEALRAAGWTSGEAIEARLRHAIRSGNFDGVHPRVVAQLKITQATIRAYAEAVDLCGSCLRSKPAEAGGF